jgi:hypothetical protein
MSDSPLNHQTRLAEPPLPVAQVNQAGDQASGLFAKPREAFSAAIKKKFRAAIKAFRVAIKASRKPLPDKLAPVGLTKLLELEKDKIKDRREPLYKGDAVGSQYLAGLGLSGGGIRSACFNLGLLEGLDRLKCDATLAGELKPTGDPNSHHNHLELFDYVSSVSGGSYAAGHLATAMLPPNPSTKHGPDAKPEGPEWLGKVPLTSKTVPGWLWGVGVWFLGVAFQLLKTGSLLLCLLALIAFVLRTLDSRDAIMFCEVLGLESDIARGFLPFWFALGIFLVGYWIHAVNQRRWLGVLWFVLAAVVILGYVGVIGLALWLPEHNWPQLFYWSPEEPPDDLSPLRSGVQSCFLLALPASVVVICLLLIVVEGFLRWPVSVAKDRMKRIVARLARRSKQPAEGTVKPPENPHSAPRDKDPAQPGTQTETWDKASIRLRTCLLAPILVALFCLAGLVTTGDIGLTSADDSASQLLMFQERSRALAVKGLWVYRTAVAVLGLTSLVFFFPRHLFKSARKVEDHSSGQADPRFAGLTRWGLEPVFRVVVFLCSYGFVLLVIFVLYSTVAGENISGYYDWRESLPPAAFHQDDFRDPVQAWERIALDAAVELPPPVGPPDFRPGTRARFAARLMAVRMKDFPFDRDRVSEAEIRRWALGRALTLEQDRAIDTEIRVWSSMPWIVRLFPNPLMGLGPAKPWTESGYGLMSASWRPYALNSMQFRFRERLASRIAGAVLSDPELYLDLPDAPPGEKPRGQEAESGPSLREKYLARAKSLATLSSRGPAIQAAIRNNNRLALQLYLPEYVRDRKNKVVFASIVWKEDQWSRFRIFLIAGTLWILCCAVDVNLLSLQKFYREHVIDSWVKVPRGKHVNRWLHDTEPTYRGYEYGKQPGDEAEKKRRAPLLLINATLEGNRSLGAEPDLSQNIFTFSPIASGSGDKHWLNKRGGDKGDKRGPALARGGPGSWLNKRGGGKAGKGTRSLARESDLDIGNIVATSGAFLSPGTIANPFLSAILHLLNIQTGYWARDPDKFAKRSPWEGLKFHFSQSLGIDCEGDSRFMLTDGAHAENLGLYVLFQRRCSLIVASDCSQEDRSEKPHRRFDTLIQVLQQAQVDGIEVGPFLNSRGYRQWLKTGDVPKDGGDYGDSCFHKKSAGLDLLRPADPAPSEPSSPWNVIASAIALGWPSRRAPAEPAPRPGAGTTSPHVNGKTPGPAAGGTVNTGTEFAQEHYLFAQIVYPDKSQGLLVYLRPTLTGDEGDSLLHGAAGSRFPDDDPMDQFYTPAKMNTYRLLGRHTAVELMSDPVMINALVRIAQGKTAGIVLNPQVEEWDVRQDCASQCKLIGLSCLGNRQRTFRPPVPQDEKMSEETCQTLVSLMANQSGPSG